MPTDLTTDAEEMRAAFERLVIDSYGFKRSRKGTYVNPAIAKCWTWFKLGASYAAQLNTTEGKPE